MTGPTTGQADHRNKSALEHEEHGCARLGLALKEKFDEFENLKNFRNE
jgi:hypothetical protein